MTRPEGSSWRHEHCIAHAVGDLSRRLCNALHDTQSRAHEPGEAAPEEEDLVSQSQGPDRWSQGTPSMNKDGRSTRAIQGERRADRSAAISSRVGS